MEIIKSLNLNRNPKDVQPGSLVCAKNMVVDYSSSYLTNEPGFAVGFECPNSGEFIVGCIPCISEIVIFTWNRNTKESKIYRKSDGGNAREVITGWKYSGGKLTGSFTYNYKKELIIALGEYDAVDLSGNNIQVPFKCWNLDNNNVSNSYNIEDTIPKFKVNRAINNDGTLVCGVYTFFIRFKIDEASYTKWFQITDDIYIVDSIYKEKPNQMFLSNGNLVAVNADTSNFTDLSYNSNLTSNKNIIISIEYLESTNYEYYQIGYVIRHDSDVRGRIYSEFSIDENIVNVGNNEYTEEIEIEELLKSPHQFYNVKNVITYNNRLYISNYSEYKNENLQVYADKCSVGVQAIEEDIEQTKTYKKASVRLNTSIYAGSEITYNVDNVSVYNINKNGETVTYITNPKKFIKDFVSNISVIMTTKGRVDNVVTGYEANYNPPIPVGGSTFLLYEKVSYRVAFIDSQRGMGNYITLYHSDVALDDLVNYNLILKDGKLYIEVGDYERRFDSNENTDDDIVGINIEAQIHTTIIDTETGRTKEENGYMWLNNAEGVTTHPSAPNGLFRIFSTSDISTSQIIFDSEINKSLIPGQIYAFYIHYIRKDKSYTNGYPLQNKAVYDTDEYLATEGIRRGSTITKDYLFVPYKTQNNRNLFLCPSTETSSPCIRFRIYDAVIPKGYIGYFISYERLENLSVPVIPILKVTEGNITKVHVTNTDYIYSDGQIVGKYWFNPFGWLRLKKDINNHPGILDNTNNEITKLTKYRKLLNTPHVELYSEGTNDIVVDTPIIIMVDNPNIYNKKDKTLYRLTDDIFKLDDAIDTDYKYDNYIPGFYVKEKIITYDAECIISPTASHVLDKDGAIKNGYSISTKAIKNYAHELYDSYSILQDYNAGSVSLIDANAKVVGVAYNKVLSPDRLPSFLNVKEAYVSAPLKSYTNYSKNNIDTFDKTIYRSNVVSDESLVNGFREFEINNYKNIFENKGNIINVLGIGLYFIVHTEYSIFVFDRTPKLTNKTQLDIPDVFDISYQELLPSNEGFGGISSKEESIISKNGYIWFDKRNRIIFNYENGKIESISQDIYNFIKSLDIDTVRFAEDIERNRLLICFYLNEYDNEGNQVTLTLSYDFNIKHYISLHDYSFTHNFRTSAVSYIFDENKDRSRLYVYNIKSIGFKNIWSVGNKYYDSYITEILFGNYEFNVVNDIKMKNTETYNPISNKARTLYAPKRQYNVNEKETYEYSRRAGKIEEKPQIVILNNGQYSFININEEFRVTYTTDGTIPSNNNGNLFRIIDNDNSDLILQAKKGTVIKYGIYVFANAPTDIIDVKTKTILDENDYDGTPPTIDTFKYTDGGGHLRIGVTIEQSGFFGTTYYTLDGTDPTEKSQNINSFFGDYYRADPNTDFQWGNNWCYSKSKAITYNKDIIIKAVTIYGSKRSEIVTFNSSTENPYPEPIAPVIKEEGKLIIITNNNTADPLINDASDKYGDIKYIINGDESIEYDYTKEISVEHTPTTYKPVIESITTWVYDTVSKQSSDKVTYETTVRDIFTDTVTLRAILQNDNQENNQVTIKLISGIIERRFKGDTRCKLYYTTDDSEPNVEYNQQDKIEPLGTTEEYDDETGISISPQLTTFNVKLIYADNGKIWYSNVSKVAYAPVQSEDIPVTDDIDEKDIYVPETKGENKILSNKVYKSYVDIIINDRYETPKALESLSYILNELQYYYFKNNAAEEDLIKTFSGDFIRIYSDSVDTGILDVETVGDINKINDYKHPYYEKGKWNLNYFRDKIVIPVESNKKDTSIININKKDSRFIIKTEIKDISGIKDKPFSDERSLVYGKYFVIRFIFNNDKKVKLESIDINVNKY